MKSLEWSRHWIIPGRKQVRICRGLYDRGIFTQYEAEILRGIRGRTDGHRLREPIGGLPACAWTGFLVPTSKNSVAGYRAFFRPSGPNTWGKGLFYGNAIESSAE